MARNSVSVLHAIIFIAGCVISYNIGAWSSSVGNAALRESTAAVVVPTCPACAECPASTAAATRPSNALRLIDAPAQGEHMASGQTHQMPTTPTTPVSHVPAAPASTAAVPPQPPASPGQVVLAFSTSPYQPDFKAVAMANKGPKKPTDKVTDHHYMVAYDNFLDVFRTKPINFLEIGLGCNVGQRTASNSFDNVGASAPIWPNYFAKGSNVSFVEYDKRCLEGNFGTSWDAAGSVTPVIGGQPIRIFHGDQSQIADLERALRGVGPLDVMIDDGSHRWRDQRLTTVFALTQAVKPGGLFVMEDLLTSYEDYWKSHPTPNYNIGGAQPMSKMIIDMFTASVQSLSTSPDEQVNAVLPELGWSACATNEVCVFHRKAPGPITKPAAPASPNAPAILDIAGPRSTAATFLASFMAPFQGSASAKPIRILNADPIACELAQSGAVATAWSGLFNQPVDLTVAVVPGCKPPPPMTNGLDNVKYLIPNADMSRWPSSLGGGFDIILDGTPGTSRVESIFTWQRGSSRPSALAAHGIYLASSFAEFRLLGRWLDTLMHPNGGYKGASVALEFLACANVPGSPAPCALRFQPR